MLKPNSIVVLHANDILPTNADGVMAFKQNADLFYLGGNRARDDARRGGPETAGDSLRQGNQRAHRRLGGAEGDQGTGARTERHPARRVEPFLRGNAPFARAPGRAHLFADQRAPARPGHRRDAQRPLREALPGALSSAPLRATGAADAPLAHHEGRGGGRPHPQGLRNHRRRVRPRAQVPAPRSGGVGNRGGVAPRVHPARIARIRLPAHHWFRSEQLRAPLRRKRPALRGRGFGSARRGRRIRGMELGPHPHRAGQRPLHAWGSSTPRRPRRRARTSPW